MQYCCIWKGGLLYCCRNKMAKRIISRRNRRSISSMLNLLFVVLYILSSSGAGMFHSISHETRHEVSHGSEDEKDPCHRSIYHSGSHGGCSHGSHFIASDKCPMCDVVFHGDQLPGPDIVFSESHLSENYIFYNLPSSGHQAVISSSRAPPAYL